MTRPTLPITYRARKSRTLLLILGGAAFTLIGGWMITRGESMGWLCAGFFGLCTVVFAAQLHPRAAWLTLREDGIEFSSLFRPTFIRWEAIAGFGTYQLRQGFLPVSTQVGINFAPRDPGVKAGRAFAQSLTGFEGALPDTYGFKASELAALLEEIRREKAAALPPPQSD